MLIFFLSRSGQSQPVQLVSSRPSGQAGGAGGGGLPVGIEADAHQIVYNFFFSPSGSNRRGESAEKVQENPLKANTFKVCDFVL